MLHKRMARWLGGSLLALTLVGLQARAVPLPTPGSVAVPDTPGALSTAGITLLNTVANTFNTGGGTPASGTYTTNVYREGAGTTSPFGAGAITFAYQFTSNAASVGPIGRITASLFNGYLTDVVMDSANNIQGAAPVGTRPPSSADRDVTGNVVGFNYSGAAGVTAGQRIITVVIRTNATAFASGFLSFIDGSTDPNRPAFAPAGPVVPEPATMLMGLVVGASALGVAWRKKSSQVDGSVAGA